MGVPFLLGPATPLLRITAEQLELMAESGALARLPRIELRDGVLCQLNAQYRPHLLAKTAVYDGLRDSLRPLGLPLGVAQEGSVRLGEHEVPMPDVLVWQVQRGRGAVPGELVRLVVEVSDTTLDEDLGRKRLVYAAGGIPEYWVVDLPNQAVHQFWAPGEDGYARNAKVPFGERIAAATLPGLGFDTGTLRDDA